MSAASRGAQVVAGPRADCRMDSEGALTVAFALPEAPRPRGRPEPREPALLLHLRPGRGAEHDPESLLRLPLERDADDRWRAVLPPHGPVLAEGRWDVYAEDAAGDPQGPDSPAGSPLLRRRLTAGLRDLRLLLDRRPDPARSPLAVRIPYTTKDGYLAVRAWLRTAHAEAGEIDLSDDTLTVRARLLGARLERGATAVLRRRGRDPRVQEVEVRDEGGGEFSCTFGYREMTAARTDEQEFWDLSVSPDGGSRRVRIGRLLDDVADKKSIFTFPAAVLDGAVVRPYYTVDNDLSVDVTG